MTNLRVGVIGIGYLGSKHAQIYHKIQNCSLVAVCDINKSIVKEASLTLGAPGYSDFRELFGKVDAVSIAVPTKLHYEVAKGFLSRGIHTLVEKPFTSNIKEASALIKLARKSKLILQVGHIERFNSAFSAALKLIKEPKFIECHRLSPFPSRSLDIGVTLDLMIHDIDIILGLVNSPIKRIEAIGVTVLTQFEDIANARITFKNGCVCNLTASRVSDETMRKIRIFQKDTYISLDYRNAKAVVYKKNGLNISKEDLPIEKEQPLEKELASFVECALNNKEPLVCGETAKDALAIALKIQHQICQKNTS